MTYDTLANQDSINKTVTSLKANNFDVLIIKSKDETLETIKKTH